MKSLLLVLLLLVPSFAARRCVTCPRDAHGRIQRSAATKREFRRTHACPATGKVQKNCPGYVLDHVIPLECGGLDRPENLQFQTIADAKAKDRIEPLCRK